MNLPSSALVMIVLPIACATACRCSPATIQSNDSHQTPSACSEQVVASATDDLQRVEALKKTHYLFRRLRTTRVIGARIVVPASRGRTAEKLQSLLECAIAHKTAASTSPFALPGIDARVWSVGDGLAIDISSRDRGVAREILRRASLALNKKGD